MKRIKKLLVDCLEPFLSHTLSSSSGIHHLMSWTFIWKHENTIKWKWLLCLQVIVILGYHFFVFCYLLNLVLIKLALLWVFLFQFKIFFIRYENLFILLREILCQFFNFLKEALSLCIKTRKLLFCWFVMRIL
jgi:hypothetical protein